MKIVLFEVPISEQEVFKIFFNDLEVVYLEEKLTADTAHKAKDAEVISVFINSTVNKDVLDLLPNLKYISTRSTGVDHIDLSYCEGKGVKVSNVPAYGSKTVAEFTFALITALSRNVYGAVQKLKQDGVFAIEGLRGFDLHGKTLGVIGTGKIGKNVIKIAKGFDMNVVAYDMYPDKEYSKEFDFTYKSLLEVLGESDIITLHTPYTKESYHLINRENINSIKKGAYVINTARGELIDTDVLIEALLDGRVAGAGLDVLEGERELKEELNLLSSPDNSLAIKNYKTLLEDKALVDMKNVIVTPHIAFYSKEAEWEIVKTTADNIRGFISDRPSNLIK